MTYFRNGMPRRQRGAVLVVSLIMLAVLTLFVISMIKTSVIELKIGGSSQIASINLAAADAAVDNFLALNGGRFAPGWLTLVGAQGPVAGSFAYTAANSAYGALGSSVVVVAKPVELRRVEPDRHHVWCDEPAGRAVRPCRHRHRGPWHRRRRCSASRRAGRCAGRVVLRIAAKGCRRICAGNPVVKFYQ